LNAAINKLRLLTTALEGVGRPTDVKLGITERKGEQSQKTHKRPVFITVKSAPDYNVWA